MSGDELVRFGTLHPDGRAPEGLGDAGRELYLAIRAEVPDGFELDNDDT